MSAKEIMLPQPALTGKAGAGPGAGAGADAGQVQMQQMDEDSNAERIVNVLMTLDIMAL